MPEVSELLKSAHSTLSALVEHFDALSEIAEKHKAAAAQLNATSQELSMASKRLEAVKVELKKAEEDLASKRHLINDEAARALIDTKRQIAGEQETLKKLQAQVAAERAEHDNILAGMAALGQRLRV